MTSFARYGAVLAVAGLMTAGVAGAATARKHPGAPSPPAINCPITMAAQQEAGTLTPKQVQARHKARDAAPAHRLRFTLKNRTFAAISSMQLRVSGWNGAPRDLPLVTTGARSSNAWKLVGVTVNIGSHKAAQTDVWVWGLISVNAIDLVSVRYADGSHWKAASPDACRVVPDPTMLITRR